MVLSKLGLKAEALPVLGIVSGNDYCGNIPQLGINRNLEVLREIQNTCFSSHSMLDEYLARSKVEWSFDAASKVFLEGDEGGPAPVVDYADLNQKRSTALQEIHRLKQALIDNRQQKK